MVSSLVLMNNLDNRKKLIYYLELMLKSGDKLRYKNEYGDSIIHEICFYCNEKTINEMIVLLDIYNIDINRVNLFGLSPLHIVANKCSYDLFVNMMYLYVRKGYKLDEKDYLGNTALNYLYYSLVYHKDLIEENYNWIVDKNYIEGRIPLMYNYQRKDYDKKLSNFHHILEFYDNEGVDLSYKNKMGMDLYSYILSDLNKMNHKNILKILSINEKRNYSFDIVNSDEKLIHKGCKMKSINMLNNIIDVYIRNNLNLDDRCEKNYSIIDYLCKYRLFEILDSILLIFMEDDLLKEEKTRISLMNKIFLTGLPSSIEMILDYYESENKNIYLRDNSACPLTFLLYSIIKINLEKEKLRNDENKKEILDKLYILCHRLIDIYIVRGYDMDKPDVEGNNLLSYALTTRERSLIVKMINIYLERGYKIIDSGNGISLINLMKDYEDILYMLMGRIEESELNNKDKFEKCLLHYVCNYCSKDMILKFIDIYSKNKFNMRLKDIDGLIPMNYLMWNNKLDKKMRDDIKKIMKKKN